MPSVEVRMGTRCTFECVQTLPHRAITDRVHVDLEALGRQRRGDRHEVVGSDEREPTGLRFARCGAVRREHRRGAVLTDPVLHDLDRGGTEAVVPRPLASGSEFVDLVESAFGTPPQCTDDSRGQFTGFVGVEVGRQDVVEPEQRYAHPGVLPAGDAHRVQMSLSCEQRAVHEVRRDGGDEIGYRIGRSFEEHPRWHAFGVANDLAAGGIACAARSIPTICSALVFAQTPCPSWLVSTTGRALTAASMSWRVGKPPGNASPYQPPPLITGSSGCVRA